MAAMTTNSSVPPAVPAGGKKPNPFAKKGAAPAGKGKAPAGKGASRIPPGAKQIGSAKTGPLDGKTLASMKNSMKF